MDAGRGPASAMMSFHDFAHAFHRFGIMSFAGDAQGRREEKDEEETKSSPAATTTAMRAVFENANRGNWPGDRKVGSFPWLAPRSVLEEAGRVHETVTTFLVFTLTRTSTPTLAPFLGKTHSDLDAETGTCLMFLSLSQRRRYSTLCLDVS